MVVSSLNLLLLLLLLSRFSHVRLCATPQTAATRLPYKEKKRSEIGVHAEGGEDPRDENLATSGAFRERPNSKGGNLQETDKQTKNLSQVLVGGQ